MVFYESFIHFNALKFIMVHNIAVSKTEAPLFEFLGIKM